MSLTAAELQAILGRSGAVKRKHVANPLAPRRPRLLVVLREFLGDGRAYFIEDIASQTGYAQESIGRDLAKLSRDGVVECVHIAGHAMWSLTRIGG